MVSLLTLLLNSSTKLSHTPKVGLAIFSLKFFCILSGNIPSFVYFTSASNSAHTHLTTTSAVSTSQ